MKEIQKLKKAIKIIAGAILLCSGCAAACTLIQGSRRRDEDSTDEYEDYADEGYAEWYSATKSFCQYPLIALKNFRG